MAGLGLLLEPMLAVLGGSWDLGPLLALCRQSWAALGAYVGGLGPYVGGLRPLSGPMLAVLGRSCGLSRWSWAALGA